MSVERTHGGDRQHGDICPHCGEQGFDGQGWFNVGAVRMYRKQCWNCETIFAVQDPADR